MDKILVIKLGALGDVITSLGPMAAIRRHHPEAHITLLTTKSFAGIGRDCGYFNDVIIDTKPKMFDLPGWLALRRTLNARRFTRVYDLQNNDRTALYLRLFSPRPEWVGAAPGASHRNSSPLRTAGRAYDGHVQTLAIVGISDVTPDSLSWMKADVSRFDLPSPYMLLVPGCSPQHPAKRWPVEYYRDAAQSLIKEGYQVAVIGGAAEAHVNERIAEGLDVKDLTGQTQLYDIAGLARDAAGAIGNDTGPSHIISATGCPIVILYCSHESTLKKHGPIGPAAHAIETSDLASVSTGDVLEKLKKIARN